MEGVILEKYQCLECSHCLTWCVPEIDIATIVESARNQIVEEEKYPKGLDKMRDSIRINHNPFNEPHEERTSWSSDESRDYDIIYFTGCTASYREKEIAISTITLLKKLGFSPFVSPEEWCCSSPLLRTGFLEDAMIQARHNTEYLNSLEAKEIIVTCPGCYRALTVDYPKHGLELNKPVRHISELLKKHISKLPEGKIDGRFTYHDPCHLGRHLGIYDEPREVVERITGTSLIEMERNRENAMCCGNGAGLRTLFPEHAKMIGVERVHHAAQVGAECIVTTCPFCKNMLKNSSEDIEVIDLPELVTNAFDK